MFGDALDTKEDLVEYRPGVKRRSPENAEPMTNPQTRAYSTRGVQISLAGILGIRESRGRGRPSTGRNESSVSDGGSGSRRRSAGGKAVRNHKVNGRGGVTEPTPSALVDSVSKQGREIGGRKGRPRGDDKEGPSRKKRREGDCGKEILLALSGQRPVAIASGKGKGSTDFEASVVAKRSLRHRRPNSKYLDDALI